MITSHDVLGVLSPASCPTVIVQSGSQCFLQDSVSSSITSHLACPHFSSPGLQEPLVVFLLVLCAVHTSWRLCCPQYFPSRPLSNCPLAMYLLSSTHFPGQNHCVCSLFGHLGLVAVVSWCPLWPAVLARPLWRSGHVPHVGADYQMLLGLSSGWFEQSIPDMCRPI